MKGEGVAATQEIESVAERFRNVATGHICDALVHIGILTPVLTPRLRPLTSAIKMAGPAVTLKLAMSRTRDDSRRLNELLEDSVKPGDVVVIDAQGMLTAAVFGDRAAFTAQRSGAVGAILNAGSRDIDGLEDLDFPVRAIGAALPASEGIFQGVELDGDVIIEGVLVRPGDWLVADESGTCVVPAEHLERVLELAEEREEIDEDSFEKLRAGKSMREVHRHFKDDDVDQIRRTE
jgi:regulator of RNase E activity RraA